MLIEELKFKLGLNDIYDIKCGYEAGCLGYSLYNQITAAGVKCVILAPTTILTQQGQRIKTDARDALMIAQCLSYGGYRLVYIPTEEDDSVNEYLRSKEGFVISPKQYILVLLGETINISDNITPYLRAKTRYTRLGLIVINQHCNPTYSRNLGVGLYNATDYPIKIYSAYSIVQLVFENLEGTTSEIKSDKNKEGAHYQNENGAFRGAKFSEQLLNDVWDKILK